MTRNTIIQISVSVVMAGLLLAAAVNGMVSWSRGRYAPRAFLAAAAIVLIVSLIGLANSWPTVLAALSTAAPLQLQLIGGAAIGAIGLTIVASLVGLAMGTLPVKLAAMPRLPDRDAIRLGIAGGLVMAGTSAVASAIRAAEWARVPPIDSLGSVIPIADAALDPVTGLLTRIAVSTAALIAIDRWTASWTRRRVPAALALALVGFLSGGAPVSSHLGAWAIAGLLPAAALLAGYVTLLRFDLTMTPVALGTSGVVGALLRAAGHPYPGAVVGSVLAAVLVTLLAAAWFRALRQDVPARVAPAV